MKFIHFIFLFSGTVIANCNENWEHVQKIGTANTYVMKNKSFFYFYPFEKYKSENLFLIRGDSFHSYFKSNDYIFGNYIRKNGSVVSGWLKAESLVGSSSKSHYSPPEISKSDFVIISPYKNIELGSSYEQFYKAWGKCEINKQPDIGISGGFITNGDEIYKYFDNFWTGFTIRSSNINFQLTGMDYNYYRITTITINSKKYMTSRGITIGDTTDNIFASYGKPLNLDKVQVIYKFKNSTLSFDINNGVVEKIVMDEQAE
ncbi:hypothetical protein NAT02_02800 [Aeromonas hydrophila]|uniref:hypothetical protein n=1 Tax=Aeromonas hydrophila TaxID=644 RepID=UPI001A186827|nr:hypothetical protein [Aeromonas hydrophila]MCP3241817.1 hypothetical protein [Aeromonas hydrophila]HAU4897078.1 hypothetical protein [Aeromonas hydrophila]